MEPSETGTSSSSHSYLAGIGVNAAILLAVLLFLGAIAMLYYRSLTLVEPSSIVDVRGDNSLNGAIVQISGPGLDAPLQAHFDQKHGYFARFFLDRGSYRLTVKRNGESLSPPQYFFLADRTHATVPIQRFPATNPGD